MNTPNLTPLSPLEISGALCSRIIHDLSNLISGIIGNAEYAQRNGADSANLQKALQAISVSANSAGRLLGQFLPLQQAIAGSVFPYEASEQAGLIGESAGLVPGWRITVPQQLHGAVLVQPLWLTSAVMQIARETETTMGEINFECGPAVYPVVWSGQNANSPQPARLFQIQLSYRGDQPLFPLQGDTSHEKFPLLAAIELIRRFKGQIQARPKTPGRQEITIMLPLM